MTEEYYESTECTDCCPTCNWKLYLVNDADGLTKFSKGEFVRVIDEMDDNWEVSVYKTDMFWNALRNDNWNKVKFKIRYSRLRPVVYSNENLYPTAFDKLAEKKTFTDAAIEKAEENYETVMWFVKALSEFTQTLTNTASNFRALANDLMTAVETKNAKQFNKTMDNCKETIKFLKDDPMMKDLKAVMKQFDTWDSIEDYFSPLELIG